ncbi:ATP synthase F0 [Lineolata rhizophorae]|uniref:ATP synthase F0 n=1 Tax=Lineolata rhizophorae TaxID=578093 RepID=A0A6A6NU04_9PEZI|nr:ATP synthase F0 [Lineolata rhizophorae]
MAGSGNVAERVQNGVHSVNPFRSREEHTRASIISLKILTAVTWLVAVIFTLYYTVERPHEGHYARRTIWGQNNRVRTPFSLDSIITSIFFIVLWILQVGYCWHLYSNNAAYVAAAANVGAHFVANNLLFFGFIHLWVRSHFWLAELLVVINLLNLSAAYLRHPATPRFIHVPVVSAPLAWNFVALFWCGAAMVHAHTLAARIVANIFIWAIFVFGVFFLAVFKDYTMGFSLSILCAALGVAQFLTKLVALQWIFAFVIMGVLFVLSCAVAVPGFLGIRDPFKRGEIVSEDRERAPLLQDE